MKIEWAPLNVPLERRLQTFATALWTSFPLYATFGSFIVMFLIVVYGNVYWRVGNLLYAGYIFYDYKKNFSVVPGLGALWLRNNWLWKNFRNYFPVELVKTSDLSPDRNYILACFPHSIWCYGPMINMCLDIQPWFDLFPKIRPKIAGVNILQYNPYIREFHRYTGLIAAEKQSILNHVCTSNDPNHPINKDGFTSNAVGISVGGAEEMINTRPRDYTCVLKNRRGFIKIALQAGCPLVPVFSFGDVDTFTPIQNKCLRNFQKNFKKYIKIGLPFVNGRGFFQYSFGVIPYRKRIVQVVGAPIEVTKCTNPTNEQIEELHQIFTEAITDLFETHKGKYLENSDELKIKIV